jgi:hypothetical protein
MVILKLLAGSHLCGVGRAEIILAMQHELAHLLEIDENSK